MLHKEISGLHQAAYLLGFFAICSQVLGLFRDRILASHFGAGNILDLYYSAFRIPDLLFATVASIVSISVLIPFLIERFQKSDEAAREFLDTVFSFFFCFMLVVGIVAYVTTPFFMAHLFPTFAKTASFPDLIHLTRILLLSPIFLGFSNLLASITQVHKRFFIYAMSPVVYNVGIIIGALFLYPMLGISGLGWGVALGAAFHFGIQLPFLFSQNLLPRLRFPINFASIRHVIFVSLPRTITVSSNEIAELFLISFASFFSAGSISVFNFSFNLQAVPFSIIGVSYSLAAFPTLTKLFSGGNHGEFVEQMQNSSRHIIFWSVPITVMFIVLRAQIVRVILGAGRFDWNDTRLTAACLALFTVSLLGQNLVALFVRSYYSQGKTKTPLWMNVISAIIIVAGSFYLSHFFDHNQFFRNFVESIMKVQGITGTVVLMLPLGYSIGIMFNLIVHWIGFEYHFPKFSKPVLRTLFEAVSSAVIMGYVTYISLNILAFIFNTNTTLGIFLQGFVAGDVGIVCGIAILYLLKSKELAEVWSTLHKKIWKAKAVLPDAELQ